MFELWRFGLTGISRVGLCLSYRYCCFAVALCCWRLTGFVSVCCSILYLHSLSNSFSLTSQFSSESLILQSTSTIQVWIHSSIHLHSTSESRWCRELRRAAASWWCCFEPISLLISLRGPCFCLINRSLDQKCRRSTLINEVLHQDQQFLPCWRQWFLSLINFVYSHQSYCWYCNGSKTVHPVRPYEFVIAAAELHFSCIHFRFESIF